MRSILVPIELNKFGDSILETALLLAQRFDSYIEGFALRPASASVLVSIDVPSTAEIDGLEQRDAQTVAQICAFFETFMRAHNVPHWREGMEGLSFGWFETGPGDNMVGSRGRIFDVTVLGRPTDDRRGPRMVTVENSLFESGRPLMLAPPAAPTQLGENILIAWNCSAEQARATAFALPLLQRARRVSVLTVDDGSVTTPTGDELARNLELHGVTAEAVTTRAARGGTGEAILAHAQLHGCDLLVKGAYTQSRLKQLIFGGATRHVLENATIPVFMAH